MKKQILLHCWLRHQQYASISHFQSVQYLFLNILFKLHEIPNVCHAGSLVQRFTVFFFTLSNCKPLIWAASTIRQAFFARILYVCTKKPSCGTRKSVYFSWVTQPASWLEIWLRMAEAKPNLNNMVCLWSNKHFLPDPVLPMCHNVLTCSAMSEPFIFLYFRIELL